MGLKLSGGTGVRSSDTFATDEFNPVDSCSKGRSNYEVRLEGKAGGAMRRFFALAGPIFVFASVAGAQTNAIQSWNFSSVSLVPAPFANGAASIANPSSPLEPRAELP